MYLPQRFNKYTPPALTGTAAGAANSPLLGTTQRFSVPRNWPIEDIWLRVNFVVNTGGLTLVASPTTPDQYDNILQLVQHINFSVNDGKQPRSVIDCSGIGLLEYQEKDATQVDIGTRILLALSQGTTLAAGNYSLMYRLPMVDNSIAEPLRSRLYLPAHRYPQDPVLTVTFQNAATIYSAGNINSIVCDILIVGRQPTPQSEALLAQTAGTNPWGYIDWDLLETPFVIPVGTGAEQRLALPLPGSYCNLLFRHYQGGATITRKEIDNGATGSSFGNENRWRIETAGNAIREWNWQQLRVLTENNQMVTPNLISGLFASTASGSYTGGTSLATPQNLLLPMAGGSIPSGQFMRYANSCWLDFLTDGQTEDMARELGSVLDCNTPANTGLKMEIIGIPTNVSTNASQLSVMGRRLFGNLARWQQFA